MQMRNIKDRSRSSQANSRLQEFQSFAKQHVFSCLIYSCTIDIASYPTIFLVLESSLLASIGKTEQIMDEKVFLNSYSSVFLTLLEYVGSVPNNAAKKHTMKVCQLPSIQKGVESAFAVAYNIIS